MSLILQRRGLVDEYNGYQFRRESMALDSAGKLIYPHNARFEQGPFGDNAILVEEGTENLLSDKLSPNTWTKGSEADIVESAGLAPDGTLSAYKVIFNGTSVSANRIYINSIGSANHKCFSVWMRADVPQGVVVVFSDQYSDGNDKRERISFTQEWQRFSIVETDKLRPIRLQIQRGAGSEAQEFYFWNPQLEQKPYATTFTPSVRANEEIIIPTAGLLSPEQGTIELDIMLLEQPSVVGKHMPLFQDLYIHKAIDWVYLHTGINRFRAKILSDTWNRLAFTWSGGLVESMVMYLNGDRVPVSYEDERYPNLPNWWEELKIRSKVDSSGEGSKLLANLRLSSIARTQEQLAPLDRPPEVDEYTTLYLPFNEADGTRAAKSISI